MCMQKKLCLFFQGILELNPAFRDYAERTEKVEAILLELKSKDLFVTLRGWRNEYYEVKDTSSNCLLKMDRSATPLFGIRNYGVTINGYVNHPEKGEFNAKNRSKQATKKL